MLRFLTGSLGEFLDRRFSSEPLKRLVLANSLYGKHGGPYQPGTAMGLLFHLLSGGDYGWRYGTGKFPKDAPDTAPSGRCVRR